MTIYFGIEKTKEVKLKVYLTPLQDITIPSIVRIWNNWVISLSKDQNASRIGKKKNFVKTYENSN